MSNETYTRKQIEDWAAKSHDSYRVKDMLRDFDREQARDAEAERWVHRWRKIRGCTAPLEGQFRDEYVRNMTEFLAELRSELPANHIADAGKMVSELRAAEPQKPAACDVTAEELAKVALAALDRSVSGSEAPGVVADALRPHLRVAVV